MWCYITLYLPSVCVQIANSLFPIRVSTDLRSIPGFQLLGKPNPPEILSNKVILTPPAPGNQRGAVWSEKTLDYASWTVDVDFRTTGPERGSGNIQVWLANKGKDEIGTSSVYTAGKFQGLAIVIDQYAGSVRASPSSIA
jgi:mannose-binding lectin 1